jgi:hypothetical protein
MALGVFQKYFRKNSDDSAETHPAQSYAFNMAVATGIVQRPYC